MNIKTILKKVCESIGIVNKTGCSRVQRENYNMEEIKDKKVEETEKVDEKPMEEDKKMVDGENIDLKDKKVEVEIEDEKKEEPMEKEESKVEEEEPKENQVVEAPPSGNGIRIEDLVTKDELADRLSAMESKMEALINENKGLTEKLTKMSEKYEEKDFGGFSKQGVQEKDRIANDTFDEYCKQFC